MKLSLGISTCPNDTFAFHALMERRIDLGELEYAVELLDVEELNRGLFAGRFDVAKASFHAALHLTDRYALLPAGAAVGFGVGPLLLARPGAPEVPDETSRVLTPGRFTTAHLLLRLLHPQAQRCEHVVFSSILPALARGDADFGVVIHEGRFTYEGWGVRLVADLGADWECATGAPVPLGGILVSRALPASVQRAVGSQIATSLAYARRHRDEAFATMRAFAQEFAPDVIWAHVDTYVTEDTFSLGSAARAGLAALEVRARARGELPLEAPPLAIVDGP